MKMCFCLNATALRLCSTAPFRDVTGKPDRITARRQITESVFLPYSFVPVGVCADVKSKNVYIIKLLSATSCQTCQ